MTKTLPFCAILTVILAVFCLVVNIFSDTAKGKNDSCGHVGGMTFYAVCFNTFQTASSAENYAKSIHNRGAGGTVIFEGGFKVLGVIFRNESDALSVCSKTEKQIQFKPSVFKLAVEKIILENNPKFNASLQKYEKAIMTAFDRISDAILRHETKTLAFEEIKKALAEIAKASFYYSDGENPEGMQIGIKAEAQTVAHKVKSVTEQNDVSFFSAELRKLQIDMIVDYRKFLRENLK